MDQFEEGAFTVSTTTRDGATIGVVTATGDIDMGSSPAFRNALLDAVGSGARAIVANLLAVRFVDSSCLGALVACHNRLREVDGTLTVAVTNPQIIKIFKLSGLDKTFKIVASEHDAVGSHLRIVPDP